MKKFSKISLLSLALMSLTTTAVLAGPISSKPLTGAKIHGYMPYMNSIGTRVVLGGEKDANGYVTLSVGDVIEVPTHLSKDQLQDLRLFDFADQDGDPAASNGQKYSVNGVERMGGTEFEIQWFAITPKDNKTWDEVKSWGDVTPTALEGTFYEDNQVSKSLIVPAEAGGSRIGFVAIPTSEYGVPKTGAPIYAYDIGKFWTQEAPENPGTCEDLGDACDNNPGTPTEENKEGGGGEVAQPDGVINIYNAKTNKLVRPEDSLFVNATYYATIQIKDGETYREPNANELKSLSWDIMDTATGLPAYTYTADDSTRVSTTPSDDVAPTGFKKYTFTTQTTNADASEALQKLGPNYSEQGFSLRVNITAEPNEATPAE